MNEAQIRGNDARALLENPLFKGAVEAVQSSIESQELACAPDDRDKCVRLIITKQLLAGVVREIERYVEDGQVEDIRENKRQNVIKRTFTR